MLRNESPAFFKQLIPAKPTDFTNLNTGGKYTHNTHFDASRRDKKGLKSSRDKKEGTYRTREGDKSLLM